MKNVRHEAILRIISEKDIETQTDLLAALNDSGLTVTQATVSRDIRELCLVKEQSPSGKYRYAAGVSSETRDNSGKLRTIFRECVVSCAAARNIVVIKTLPGLAQAASAAIDGMGVRNLVGTVAGDDTAFLAMRDERAAVRFCEEIDSLIG
ncbi:MAG: arginine repressor [Oscillospiraceae bacterium]|jgi:transcriptional regulator of arginine metabolism|nr:arginine repressor [Oscillospiraceae bacterium]